MNEVKTTIGKFLQRYYDLEIIVSPDARVYVTKVQKSFADLFSDRINDYVFLVDKGQTPPEEIVQALFIGITNAYSDGFLVGGSDLLRKLDETRQQNRELTKDLAICMANYKALEQKHERLLRDLNPDQTEDWKKEEEENP